MLQCFSLVQRSPSEWSVCAGATPGFMWEVRRGGKAGGASRLGGGVHFYPPEVLPIAARTNHGFLCTLRSLQSNCACKLFAYPLGLNL